MKKNIIYIILTSIFVSVLFFCFSTTVYSQAKSHQVTADKHELDQLEKVYLEDMHSTLNKAGCMYSGITMTKIYETDGSLSYLVKIHHENLQYKSNEELQAMEAEMRNHISDLGNVSIVYEFSF